jgi:hypothetical protein
MTLEIQKLPPFSSVRAPLCPSLPAEIWINIFSYHTDLAHLWIVCRRVSSTLRACAEHAFAEYFLGDIHIYFQLEKHNLGGKSKRPEVPVTFDRLGKREEKETAWFRDKRTTPEICECSGIRPRPLATLKKHCDRTMRRWEEHVHAYRPEMPNYTINIQGCVNDTELPGLAIDIDKREVRFEWRKMLHLFYREHERFQTLKEAYQTHPTKQMRVSSAQLARSKKALPSESAISRSSMEAEVRKTIRRARLKEHYSNDEQKLWAIESLKHFEQYGAAGGNAKALRLDPDIAGAGLGERWFGCVNMVQELYLDEWSCLHRIDTKIEHLRSGQ